MDTDDAALKLDAVGFTAAEISSLLDVGPNYVNVARHRKKTAAAAKWTVVSLCRRSSLLLPSRARSSIGFGSGWLAGSTMPY